MKFKKLIILFRRGLGHATKSIKQADLALPQKFRLMTVQGVKEFKIFKNQLNLAILRKKF